MKKTVILLLCFIASMAGAMDDKEQLLEDLKRFQEMQQASRKQPVSMGPQESREQDAEKCRYYRMMAKWFAWELCRETAGTLCKQYVRAKL